MVVEILKIVVSGLRIPTYSVGWLRAFIIMIFIHVVMNENNDESTELRIVVCRLCTRFGKIFDPKIIMAMLCLPIANIVGTGAGTTNLKWSSI